MKSLLRLCLIVVLLLLGAGWFFRHTIWPTANDRAQNDGTTKQPVNPAKAPPAARGVFSFKSLELLALVLSSDAPITFYGKVEDQDGKPVAKARVKFSVMKSASGFPSLGLPPGSYGHVLTGDDGHFVITEQKGTSINIEAVAKEGYTEAKRNIRSFSYGHSAEPHQPDKSKPELFVLVADSGRAEVVREFVEFSYLCNGQPTAITIPFPDSPVVIDFLGTQEPKRAGEKSFSWNVEIKPRGAQVLFTQAGGPEIAPIDGYSTSVTLGFDGKDPLWGANLLGVLYLKLDNRKFVRAFISMSAYGEQEEQMGYMHCSLNPTGGRYFE